MINFRNLGLSTQIVLLAQAAEIAKARESDEQLQADDIARRHLDALTAAGFDKPQEILNRLGDLAKRLPVSLGDLVGAVVKLRQHPEQTVELRQTVDGQPLLTGETWATTLHHDPMPRPPEHDPFITPFEIIISAGHWNDLTTLPARPPERSKNKRGQRNQQKPWHPKFRRIS